VHDAGQDQLGRVTPVVLPLQCCICYWHTSWLHRCQNINRPCNPVKNVIVIVKVIDIVICYEYCCRRRSVLLMMRGVFNNTEKNRMKCICVKFTRFPCALLFLRSLTVEHFSEAYGVVCYGIFYAASHYY